MKISDIINQLRAVIPKYTDYFSNVLDIESITIFDGYIIIITTDPHGLTEGSNIVLKDVITETSISGVSQDGLVFTFTTSTDHDLTYGWPEHEYVELSGFTDDTWNGSFKLVGVPNRRTFSVKSANSLPVLNGDEVLLEVRIDGLNGRYSASVPGIYPATFPLRFPFAFYDPNEGDRTIAISGSFTDGSYSGGNISGAQRISGSVTEDRAIEQYTEQNLNDLWMFVVMSSATTSKDRSTYSDATSTKATGNDMRLRLVDGFSIYIIKNTTEDITAIEAIDICRHDLLLPILKSVNGIRFDTGLTYDGDFRCILTGHSYFDYNKAILIYQYDFEVVMDLTNDDVVAPEDTRAFRDVDYYLNVGEEDTDQMTILPIDLDEEPL